MDANQAQAFAQDENRPGLREALFEEMRQAYQPFHDAVEKAKKAGFIIGYMPPAVRQTDGQIVYPMRMR